jgi:hypothetical protein
VSISRAHRLIGIIALACFLGTGIYMRVRFPGLYEGREAIRFLFRANHIYLAMAAALNLALGLPPASRVEGGRRLIQAAASGLVLVSPAVLLGAFFIDPPEPDSGRMLTRVGVVMAIVGVVLRLLATPRDARR